MGRLLSLAAAGAMALASSAGADPAPRVSLGAWALQSSAKVAAKGDALSRPGFDAKGWHRGLVPGTVVGSLVAEGVYPDPYFGMNLRKIPGTDYPIGQRFSLLPTPADSPFHGSWWYRAEFDAPAGKDRSLSLHFDGINYRANVWFNGTQIATAKDVAGAFRRYAFDVAKLAHPGARNAVAVEVFLPEPGDLAIMWVDWSPTPADKNMGLWGEAYATTSGPIALRNPYVIPDLDLPSLDAAHLTVTAEAWNTTDAPVTGTVGGAIGPIRFSRDVALKPGEHATVRFTPKDTPALDVAHPRLWWPYRMGSPEMYTADLQATVGGVASDTAQVAFGIREFTDEITKEGHRLYRVNGRPLLIRGGGWASDMMLRPKTAERMGAELRYVREMGLNTVRLEGKLEGDDLLYDMADRQGILIMPGWCCCDQWEHWDKWDAEDHRVGPASLRDQLLRLRNHPSVFVWLNGSDGPPPADVETAYLAVEKEVEWSRPTLSSAAEAPGPVSGPSGVKMRGPYDYVPPSYWLTDTKHGGAYGFDTEVGPGAAIPPIESLREMLPPEHLWPIDGFWNFHAGGDEFKDVARFTAALAARFGPSAGVEDYARKSQALAYEGERAMFEAFGRNKHTSTGVIQWMLNNAWPSIIWHLYDYYLRPGGGYYGAKVACEPLHVQYSYDDRSVVVVNDTPKPFTGVAVKAQLLDRDGKELLARDAAVDVAADGVARALVLPEPGPGVDGAYFVRLSLQDGGKTVSTNTYWLSTRPDVLDWEKTEWFYTPTKTHADMSALSSLKATTLSATSVSEPGAAEGRARVTVRNTGSALAFQVHLQLVDTAGKEPVPVYWDDNYFELLPGETREVAVAYPRDARGPELAVRAEAWNAPAR